MSGVDFDAFASTLRSNVKDIASEILPGQQLAALKDVDAFVGASREELKRWLERLVRGEVTPVEFQKFLATRAATAKLEELAKADVSQAKRQKFVTSLLLLIVDIAQEIATRKANAAKKRDEDFTLGVVVNEPDEVRRSAMPRASPPRPGNGEPRRAKPPVPPDPHQPPGRFVSTGFADTTNASEPLPVESLLEVGESYYYFLEIGEPVQGAADSSLLPLPNVVPSGAELTVVLFTPGAGFATTYDVGRLQLLPNGTASVLVQPAPEYPGVDPDLLKQRLLFPVTAPKKGGKYRLRSSIYCQGVLVQSRLLEVYVSKQPPKGKPATVVHVDYTLSNTLPPTLGDLEAHSLSIMMNANDEGSHDFYFYGSAPGVEVKRPVTISATTLNGAITRARKALREASWGNDDEWNAEQKYRYETARDLARLREDLINLAGRGFDVYNLVVSNLAASGTRAQLETLLKAPGTLQIAGKQDIRFVLPAGMIYDYKIDSRLEPGDYELCSVFAKAFRDQTPLLNTACFQGACPSRGNRSAVCPSGFWGFRHAIGLPMSLGKNQSADVAFRVQYTGVPVMVVGVSTDDKLEQRVAHQDYLRELEKGWEPQDKAWFVGQSRKEVLDLLGKSKPHLVYLYCHGGVTKDKEFYLSVGAPGPASIILPANFDAYVNWEQPPHPLVFINGCRTTELDANTTLEFVTEFVQVLQACGVIGTEITVFEPLAVAFANNFWEAFLKSNLGVGEAIRQARLKLLLEQGNPLGLVYTPFVLAGTRLEKVG